MLFSKTLIILIDNAWMISGLKLSSTLPKVATQVLKSKTSQRRPVEAGQKSSDDKVSLSVINFKGKVFTEVLNE